MRDKNKIDGAYLLIKRFKNRLKCLDEVVRKVNEDKADRGAVQVLKSSLAKGRAEAVFEDMK